METLLTYEPKGPAMNHAELMLHLENAMTQSSFGHEYARMALAQPSSNLFHNDELINQMDEFHRIYEWARLRMSEINPARLKSVEENLRTQKQVLFEPVYYV